VTGQARTAYRKAGLSQAERRITYRRIPDNPSLLVEDVYAKRDAAAGAYVWQMFSAKGNTTEQLPNENAVLITGAGGRGLCKVTCLGPNDAVWSLEERGGFPLIRLKAGRGTFQVKIEAFPAKDKTR
jgi:hypothetical protein